MSERGKTRGEARGPGGSRGRVGVGVGILSAMVVLAGCASSAGPSTTTTRAGRPPPLATTTSAPSTTLPPSTTVPPVNSTSVQIQISGSTVTVVFTSASVSGSLNPSSGTFSEGGTLYTFSVTGVAFSGSPLTATGTGGLIASVAVFGGSGGVTITVKLSTPASHASYGLGHNQVGVQFS